MRFYPSLFVVLGMVCSSSSYLSILRYNSMATSFFLVSLTVVHSSHLLCCGGILVVLWWFLSPATCLTRSVTRIWDQTCNVPTELYSALTILYFPLPSRSIDLIPHFLFGFPPSLLPTTLSGSVSKHLPCVQVSQRTWGCLSKIYFSSCDGSFPTTDFF